MSSVQKFLCQMVFQCSVNTSSAYKLFYSSDNFTASNVYHAKIFLPYPSRLSIRITNFFLGGRAVCGFHLCSARRGLACCGQRASFGRCCRSASPCRHALQRMSAFALPHSSLSRCFRDYGITFCFHFIFYNFFSTKYR